MNRSRGQAPKSTLSKHKCSKTLYVKFLKVTSQRYSALSLSEVSPNEISHDSVSRWLSETKCTPKDIWHEAKNVVIPTKGILIADETVISKKRSSKIEIARYQYSGNEHDVVKGIGVLNFIWQTQIGTYTPVDYRIYSPPEDGKTKNHHFRDMLTVVKERGLNPEVVVADGWYSSLKNLKSIRDHGWYWLMPLKKNRRVNKGDQLQNLNIPPEGLSVHLQGYGWIQVFRFASKNGRAEYIGTNLPEANTGQVEEYVKRRWDIEVYHRELKQVCGLGRCQAHVGRSQRNHIGLSILCWMELAEKRIAESISIYEQQWQNVKPAISERLRIELALAH